MAVTSRARTTSRIQAERFIVWMMRRTTLMTLCRGEYERTFAGGLADRITRRVGIVAQHRCDALLRCGVIDHDARDRHRQPEQHDEQRQRLAVDDMHQREAGQNDGCQRADAVNRELEILHVTPPDEKLSHMRTVVSAGVVLPARGNGARLQCSGKRKDRKSTRLNSSHRCISYAV